MEPLAQTPGETSPPSLLHSLGQMSLFPPSDGSVQVTLLDLPESPRGGHWTLNTSGCHSAAAVSLSSVLVTPESIRPKYYLSSKACQGILRRAAKRGKALPPILEQALTKQAEREDLASPIALDT